MNHKTFQAATFLGATLTVNSTADTNDPNDGLLTLREAILISNGTRPIGASETGQVSGTPGGGLDNIVFNMGTGTPTVNVTSALPTVTNPVFINGNTGGATRVELNGTNAGAASNGLLIAANNSQVNGLVINRFANNGILLQSVSGVIVTNCYVGTNAAGTSAQPNSNSGILIAGATAQNNLIGGTTAGARNILSGNGQIGVAIDVASNNRVEGNYLGTDVTGTVAVPNNAGASCANGASNNVIGGTAAGARNLISGNRFPGVFIYGGSTGNRVEGNYIGTDVTGSLDLGNGQQGVALGVTNDPGTANNVIGGTTAAARNVISGNDQNGVILTGGVQNNRVEGNYIGTDITGTLAVGNGQGIQITGSANNNVIGGTAAGTRNLISGNVATGLFICCGAGSNRVEGNYIGTDVNGTADLGNGQQGVHVEGTSSVNNVIGGTSAAARNVISGNNLNGVNISGGANGTRVEGNYIGTNADGTGAVANSLRGVYLTNSSAFGGSFNTTNNVIGGTASGARNVISGNNQDGVFIGSGANNNRVEGNYIGTDVTGAVARGNGGIGVYVRDAPNNTIGGTGSGARNLISGNANGGVGIESTSSPAATGNLIQGNYIGTDVTGTAALGNIQGGVTITDSPNNSVGGTASGAGNLISGNQNGGILIAGFLGNNTTGNLVQGNLIGTNAGGTAAIGNSGGIALFDASNNVIGGTPSNARNVISGNSGSGIEIFQFSLPTANNLVQGNFIGVNASGTAALGNQFEGVRIEDAASNTIGGVAAGAGNLISGNGMDGIYLVDTSGNLVQGNFIGTNAAGSAKVGNGRFGVYALNAGNNVIGGTASGARNLISGNSTGIVIESGLATGNRIEGNFIGTDVSGTSNLGNTFTGVSIHASSNVTVGGTTAGAGNLIAFNGVGFASGMGVGVWNFLGPNPPQVSRNNAILGNSIFGNGANVANGGVGIDLFTCSGTPVVCTQGVSANDGGDGDDGPNSFQNFPVLTSASSGGGQTQIQGTLNSLATTGFRIEFFSNSACDSSGNGEGRTFLGATTVTTDGGGNASITAVLPVSVAAGQVVTATATRLDAGSVPVETSEFSACQAVTSACPTITVNPPTLPNGRAGQPYNQQLTQAGGGGSVSWSISAGELPAGLTLSNAGLLAGTPTVSGTFNFTVRVTDGNNCTGERVYALLLQPPCTTITVNPVSLPNGFQGTGYSQALTATGGAGAYTFAITAGGLPGGLDVTSGGVLAGTPSAPGTFNFTITATDGSGCTGARSYTIIISGNGLMFYPLPAPVRLLETRSNPPNLTGCNKPNMPIAQGSTFTLSARIACAGIPVNAAAVTGNITVVPSGAGYLTLFPGDAAQPTVANSNFKIGEITNNVFTVGLAPADGTFKIFASATTEVIIDVTGYYAPPTTGLYFHPLPSPVRLLETRPLLNGCFTPGAKLIGTGNPNADPNLDLALQGRSPIPSPCNSIPDTAQVLVGNATSVLPSGGGYLTIYPSGGTRPTVASSNYAGNDVVNGPFAVKLGADGAFKVYTFATTDLVIDILGYYSAEVADANGAGLLFTPLIIPARLLETRPDFPGFPLAGCFRPNAPLNSAQTYTQQGRNVCTVPNAARALVGNVTVINPIAGGFLTFWPSDAPTQPTVATSNYPFPVIFGYNRHYIVGLGAADGAFKMYSQFQTDLIVDVSGYFAP